MNFVADGCINFFETWVQDGDWINVLEIGFIGKRMKKLKIKIKFQKEEKYGVQISLGIEPGTFIFILCVSLLCDQQFKIILLKSNLTLIYFFRLQNNFK